MEQLGRYRIERLIGRGGMGEIYQATDTNLNRTVALKVLSAGLSMDDQFLKRFEREARLVAPLEHSNIVRLYDFGIDDVTDRPFLVMRLMEGGTLEDQIGQLQGDEIWRIFEQVASALDHANENGVVHRDIKPSNILFDTKGNAYLTDFGIARHASSNTRLTGGNIIGTPHYMSPEQCIPGRELDGRSDQYSLALVVYETLTGETAYDGDTMQLMYQHVNGNIPIEKLSQRGVPEHVVDALERATAKDPDDRFESASAFVDALSGVPQPAAGAGRRTTRRERTTAALPAQKPTAPSGGSSFKINWVYVIAALVGLTGVGMLTYNVLGLGESTNTPVAQVTNTPIVEDDATEATSPTEVPAIIADETPTDEAPTEPAATETEAPEAATSTVAPTATDAPPTETLAPTETSPPPTETPLPPTNTPPPPTNTPVPVVPTNTPLPIAVPQSVFISNITLNGDRYVVEYGTNGYTEQVPGQHIHFYWNNIREDQAGSGPTAATWFLYGGPRPFTGYGTGDRPGNATQICAVVANADHTINAGSGNCFPVP